MSESKSKTMPEPLAQLQPRSRREFLVQSSATIGVATASSTALWAAAAPSRSRAAMTELSASAAVAAMRNGELKAEDYANALLDQAERLQDLDTFVTLRPDSVREAARAADELRAAGAPLGALHGLPLPVKDSVNTKALPTTNGTRALRDFTPQEDAAILVPLFAQGAILMGKTNLHELSCGWTSNNMAFGAVRNPYDLTRTPGGSSGGSAAAVAARIAPLAIGEDTYGSIRVPATFCGLAGLRPTHERYSAVGVMPLALNKFDQLGPLAREVRDLALFDSVVTGTRQPLGAVPLQRVRIGISPEYLNTGVDPEVGRLVETALARLASAGATLVHAELPPVVHAASDVERAILGYELLDSLAAFLKSQNTGVSLDQLVAQASPNLAPLLQGSRNPGPRAKYLELLQQMKEISAAARDYFHTQNVDAIAFPPTLMPAFPQGDAQALEIGGARVDLFTAIGRNIGLGSCAGLSCLVLPAGVTAAGLPVGLEFDGPPGSDRRMLAMGLSLEHALGRITPPPLRA
jgi:indoleacetamide hydrolase